MQLSVYAKRCRLICPWCTYSGFIAINTRLTADVGNLVKIGVEKWFGNDKTRIFVLDLNDCNCQFL